MAWRRHRQQAAVFKASETAPGGVTAERAEKGQEDKDAIPYNRYLGKVPPLPLPPPPPPPPHCALNTNTATATNNSCYPL